MHAVTSLSNGKTYTPGGTTIYIDKLYECTSGVCTKYIFAGNERIASKSGQVVLYYHPDHQGSTSVVTNAGGTTEERITYYPFGGTRTDDGGIINLKHKYTGQELDSETGLYNYNARIYDPDLGRFLTPDSIGSSMGSHQWGHTSMGSGFHVDKLGSSMGSGFHVDKLRSSRVIGHQ